MKVLDDKSQVVGRPDESISEKTFLEELFKRSLACSSEQHDIFLQLRGRYEVVAMDDGQSRRQSEERLAAESAKLKGADEEIGRLRDELVKKDKELEAVKAEMSEATNVLTRAINDAVAQRDTAERQLKSAQKKLETLKDRLHRLVSAIFGKDHDILGETPAMKLTCTFALVKQLFDGACKAICATQPKPPSMKRITDIMGPFSVVPEWVRPGKRSACCMGVMRGLELAKAYHPGLKLDRLAAGFPELKADESNFSKEDFVKVHKETRPSATKIADDIELNRLETGYDEHNKMRQINLPTPVEFSLLPPPKKASEPANPVEPLPGGEEDNLMMDDISDVDLVESCNEILQSANVTGSSSQSQANVQA